MRNEVSAQLTISPHVPLPSFLLQGNCFILACGPHVNCMVPPPGHMSPKEALGPSEALPAGPVEMPGQSELSSRSVWLKLGEVLFSQREMSYRCLPSATSSNDSSSVERNNFRKQWQVEKKRLKEEL